MVSNNLAATDSNKISTSSNSNSTTNTNNNKTSTITTVTTSNTSSQQVNHTDTISKQETNFEDYDNEWDVGIGHLIIDLDADIEKSTQQNNQSVGTAGLQQLSTNLQTKVSSGKTNTENDPLAIPKTLAQKSVTKLEQVYSPSKSQAPGPSVTLSQPTTTKAIVNDSQGGVKHHHHHHHHSHHHKQNKESTTSLTEKMSSNSSTSSSKSAGKITTTAVDHQATLDKGLKMKIKRTKPGTKTSEAKHEIVKAEQNGAASGVDSDTNASTGSGKKHTIPAVSPVVVTVTPNTPQSNKRGSSSHRRDKQKDKSTRDKNDHITPIGASVTNERICNCSDTPSLNGVATTCVSTACKNRPTDSLSQRLSGSQSNSSLSSSSTSSFTMSNSGTGVNSSTNAPGPPKDINKVSLIYLCKLCFLFKMDHLRQRNYFWLKF